MASAGNFSGLILTLLVLYFRFDGMDTVRRLDVERDGFAGQGLDKNLHGRLVYTEKK